MTDAQGPPPLDVPDVPPASPGERRLDRPPSERYRSRENVPAPDAGAATPGSTDAIALDGRVSPARGIAFGAVAAIVGAVTIVVLGGPFALSAGLLVVAAGMGYVVGVATVAGAAETLAPATRRWIAATLAGLGALLGQVGLWLFARSVGGVLSPLDYLDRTFGPLVPLEALLAVAVAWWRAR